MVRISHIQFNRELLPVTHTVFESVIPSDTQVYNRIRAIQ